MVKFAIFLIMVLAVIGLALTFNRIWNKIDAEEKAEVETEIAAKLTSLKKEEELFDKIKDVDTGDVLNKRNKINKFKKI